MSRLFSGITNSVRSILGYPSPNGVYRDTEERLKTGPRDVFLPAFLPYFDDQTGESPEMNRQFRRMLSDPNVKAPLFAKIFGVAAQEIQIHPYKKKDDRSQAVADYIDWNLTRRFKGGMPSLIWHILIGGAIDGYSVNERVWGIQIRGEYAGKHVLKNVKPKIPNLDFMPLLDQWKNIVALRGLRFSSGENFDPKDFIIYANTPIFGSPVGHSDLRAAYGRYWMLDTVTKVRGMGAKKRALPIVGATYRDPTKQAALNRDMAQIESSNWLTVPEGVQLQVLELAGTANDYFSSFCKDLREEIVMSIQLALLGSMQGGQGVQRGSSAVHKDTADLGKWWLQTQFLDLLNNEETGLIPDMVDRNFQTIDGYPHASGGGIDEAELAESLKIDTGLGAIGWQFDKEELEDRYGRAWCDDPAKVLKMPAPAAAGAGHPFGANAETTVLQPVPHLPAPEIPYVHMGPKATPGVAAAEPFRFSEEWERYLNSDNSRAD